jgi:hypothetical protein
MNRSSRRAFRLQVIKASRPFFQRLLMGEAMENRALVPPLNEKRPRTTARPLMLF